MPDVSCVLAAFDGETDPAQLGIPKEHPDADRIRDLTGDSP